MEKVRRPSAACSTGSQGRAATARMSPTSGILSWVWALATSVLLAPGTARAQDLPQPLPPASSGVSSPGIQNPGPATNPGPVPDWAIPGDAPTAEPQFNTPSYKPNVGFKLVDPVDPKTTPYELTFNLFFQPRYTGFSRANRTFRQANGEVVSVNNTSDFQIIRLVPEFSGYAFDPNFYYHAFIFMTSTNNSATPLGYVGYKFCDEFAVEAGYWKLAANREFNTPYHKLFGTERSMATTFFRPGFVPGRQYQRHPLRDAALQGRPL